MAVIRINKTTNYTVMSNTHFKERKMSLKAKGLLSMMLSLPPDWDYSISGLTAICKENEGAIKSTLSELKAFGYLVITKKLPNETETGRIEYTYDIYELPQCKQEGKKQEVENQGVEILPVEIQGVENQGQLNTNESITDLSITNVLNTDIQPTTGKRFKVPTLDEVKAYCQERKNKIDPERFIDYYTAKGWKIGKQPMKDWKAAVRTWEKNNFNNTPAPNQEQPEANPGFDEWMNNFMSQKEGK